jgi:hypothetical protein
MISISIIIETENLADTFVKLAVSIGATFTIAVCKPKEMGSRGRLNVPRNSEKAYPQNNYIPTIQEVQNVRGLMILKVHLFQISWEPFLLAYRLLSQKWLQC